MLKRNAHSVTDLQYHLVFCPRYREVFPIPGSPSDVERSLRSASAALGGDLIAISVESDHIHLQVQLAPYCCVSYFIGRLKRLTSRLLPNGMSWSRGYYCSTVGAVDEYKVRSYIRSQSGTSS